MIDLVVFSVGSVRYAADLSQVRRVDTPLASENVPSPLGDCQGGRALVFEAAPSTERRLRVDTVHGVRRVPVDSLRRMPRVAAPTPVTPGAWIDGADTIILIDLHALVSDQRSS